MIYLAVFILLLFLSFHYDICGAKGGRDAWYSVILIVFILIAGLRWRLGVDTPNYLDEFYYETPRLDLLSIEDLKLTKPLWILLNSIVLTFFGRFYVVQLIHATFINTFYLYFKKFHRKINWEHPEDLNQWINWLAFNTDTTEWSRLADKYAVRDYIAEQGYEDILVPLLAVWDSPEKIDLSNLPMSFVLKMTNGCGDVIIVKDKSTASLTEIRQHFAKLFAHPFGHNTAEPHYLRIRPRVIAEAFLVATLQAADSTALIDYKLFTVGGVPRYCLTISNRNGLKNYCTDIYRLPEWEHCPDLVHHDEQHIVSNNVLPRPTTLDRMMEIASKLVGDHPFVRVDFYEVGQRVYFGEMTFTPACGRMTSLAPVLQTELGKELGRMVKCRI